MGTPGVKAEQDSSIRIEDLTEVVVSGRCFPQAKERLVPLKTAANVAYPNNCPNAFHRIGLDLMAVGAG